MDKKIKLAGEIVLFVFALGCFFYAGLSLLGRM